MACTQTARSNARESGETNRSGSGAMSSHHRKHGLLGRVGLAALVLGLLGTAGVAYAEDQILEKPLPERDRLTGDWGGTRSALEARGVVFSLDYVGEIFGISGGAYGGTHPGSGPFATYEGLFNGALDIDLEKFMGGFWIEVQRVYEN